MPVTQEECIQVLENKLQRLRLKLSSGNEALKDKVTMTEEIVLRTQESLIEELIESIRRIGDTMPDMDVVNEMTTICQEAEIPIIEKGAARNIFSWRSAITLSDGSINQLIVHYKSRTNEVEVELRAGMNRATIPIEGDWQTTTRALIAQAKQIRQTLVENEQRSDESEVEK